MSLLDLLHLHGKPPPAPTGELIHWDQTLSVGNPMIDNEHREIIDALNRFYADWVNAEHHLDVEEELRRLSALVDTHFANEEELMTRRHCPGLTGHIQDHRQMQAELRVITASFATLGSAKLEARLLRFIRKLVMGHVLSWDMDARDYLRA
ncbi:MAG: hemerythrin family [Rhodospirillaceae bacterium]|nr:MAG: hemerythrin family [Rhodospirillaceae bacterium]TNC95083.1 MAG: hemerythrin family protein [Stygiobacter sp.]